MNLIGRTAPFWIRLPSVGSQTFVPSNGLATHQGGIWERRLRLAVNAVKRDAGTLTQLSQKAHSVLPCIRNCAAWMDARMAWRTRRWDV